MISDDQIIGGCLDGKRKAYNLLYSKYAATMLGICMRYCQDRAEAEDVLQDGFIKVFTNISRYRKEGSFEGWIKRIMVNTAIDNYQKNLKHYHHASMEEIEDHTLLPGIHDNDPLIPETQDIPKEKLMEFVQRLPDGYRIVFNLFAIEGFAHKEIALKLNISENTSKTQLMKARRQLRKQLSEFIQKHDHNIVLK